MSILSKEEIKWLSTLPSFESLSFHNTNIEVFNATPKSFRDVVFPWASIEELEILHNNAVEVEMILEIED